MSPKTKDDTWLRETFEVRWLVHGKKHVSTTMHLSAAKLILKKLPASNCGRLFRVQQLDLSK